MDATLYIILDGVDEVDKGPGKPLVDLVNQIRSASDKIPQLKIRILVSGTPEILDPLFDSLEPTLLEVNLKATPQTGETSVNEEDLLLYVEDRLKRTDRLQKVDGQLKERIKKELASGARGEYSRLDYLLDDLANIQNTNQIDDILRRANESLPEIVAGKIRILNNTLTKGEIREINELLSWVNGAYDALTIGQCEGVLSLRVHGQSIGLKGRIRERYADLFTVRDGVTLREGVEQYLPTSDKTAVGKDEAKDSTDSIQEAEVTLVRKILRAHFRNVFADEEVYSRFGFDDFFQDKLGDSAVRLRLVEAECHLKIA